MRTVESIVADLTRSLDSDFCTVRNGEDVYLSPKKSLVCCNCLVHSTNRSNKPEASSKSRGACHGFAVFQTPLSSSVIRRVYDEIWD